MDEEIEEIKKLVADIKSELDIYLNELDEIVEMGTTSSYRTFIEEITPDLVTVIVKDLGEIIKSSHKLTEHFRGEDYSDFH